MREGDRDFEALMGVLKDLTALGRLRMLAENLLEMNMNERFHSVRSVMFIGLQP